jgi:hypothetical protein
MLASASFAWLSRGFFREHPWPINAATEADRLAVKEMLALRGRACDWLGAPAQWRMLRTMGPYVREFPAFAAEQLRSASSALRARLHAEARTRLCTEAHGAVQVALRARYAADASIYIDTVLATFWLAACPALQ